MDSFTIRFWLISPVLSISGSPEHQVSFGGVSLSCTRGKLIGWSVSKIVICLFCIFLSANSELSQLQLPFSLAAFWNWSRRGSQGYLEIISLNIPNLARIFNTTPYYATTNRRILQRRSRKTGQKGIKTEASASVRAGERTHGHLFNDRRETTFVQRDGIARREIPTTGLRTRTRNPLQTSL